MKLTMWHVSMVYGAVPVYEIYKVGINSNLTTTKKENYLNVAINIYLIEMFLDISGSQ